MKVRAIEAGSARFADASGSAVDCVVEFEGYGDALPFTAMADDPEEHGRLIWQLLQAGEAGPIAAFVPSPEPVPNIISDRQFAQILAMDGLITPEEALAWVGAGTIPAQLVAAVEQIPDANQRFGARMLLSGATTFLRDNPLVAMLGQILQRDDAALDDIWRRAAAL